MNRSKFAVKELDKILFPGALIKGKKLKVIKRSTLPKSQQHDRFWFLKAVLKNKTLFVELLSLVRPVIYLTLLLKMESKVYPLIINILMDYVILTNSPPVDNFDQSKIYYLQQNLRKTRLLAYLLREPIFSNFTKPIVMKLVKTLYFPEFLVKIFERVLLFICKFSYMV